jgi:nucleoside-diphosphate-sugar epimerase
MAILVTGATGYIGSAVCRRLQEAGHEVVGLARSSEAEVKLKAAGVGVVAGSLSELETLRRAAGAAEAVVHTAMGWGADSGAVDRGAVEAMLEGMAGANKPFIYTSGVWVMGNTKGRLAGEMFPLRPPALVAWRPAVEQRVMQASERKVCGVVIRPAMVYGRKGGMMAAWLTGQMPVVGDGSNHWSFVHVDDLADLYLLALERARAGSLYVAADGPAYRVKELAEAAGIREMMPLEQARQRLGLLADCLVLDQKVGSTRAGRELGWKPRRASVMALLSNGYFNE